MPARPAHFRQADVSRAVKAVRREGLGVTRIQIDPDGRISIFTTDGYDVPEPAMELEKWMAKNAS
jgi:hypothetical protein